MQRGREEAVSEHARNWRAMMRKEKRGSDFVGGGG
jgi:hypothetical protein